MQLRVSSSPHVVTGVQSSGIMLQVVLALLPACLCGIYFFGARAALILVLALLSAVATEYIIQRLSHRKVTVNDFSALVTGVLVGMNLPPTAPWWLPVVGSVFAISIVKQVFGGLGHNFMNPALAARAFLLACWPVRMAGAAFVPPVGVDAVAGATPLALLKAGEPLSSLPGLLQMAVGNIGGCIGETSTIALLAGGLFLLIRGIISWRIPLAFLVTVFALTLVFGDFNATYSLYHLMSGGLMLGAFFMATDYVTSPMTPRGHVIMGVGCGVITVLIRELGGYPEGVTYAILLMNIATPLIDRFTRPRAFGEVRSRA